MRAVLCAFLSSLAIAASSAPARSAVEVSFVLADRFTDASSRGYGSADEATLRDIQKHLEHLGERYLAPETTLRIEVLDVDLAGRTEWWHRFASHVRFVRSSTWPRMRVRYSLTAATRRLAAQEVIADPNYDMHANTRLSSDPLRYERAMLDRWFRDRFVDGVAPPK